MKKQGLSKLKRRAKHSVSVILSGSEGSITKAAKIIKNEGVVIFPTDTVYGIGAKFDDKDAVDKIYKIKGTKKQQKFPILVSSPSQLEEMAIVNNTAKKLIKKFWPGGLTIILKNKNKTGKTGFRQPDHIVPISIINSAGVPIVGTSANFHGKKTPINMGELDADFAKLADFVVLGECKNQRESTVVDTTVDPPKILRQGTVEIN